MHQKKLESDLETKFLKNRIFYTAEAMRDLDEIWGYIGDCLGSPGAAERIVNHIMDDIDLLESYASIGTELSEVTGFETDYRYMISAKYIVFYRVNDEQIIIDRILHSRRDYLQTLFENEIE